MNLEALLLALGNSREGYRLYQGGFSRKAADVFQRSIEGAPETTDLPQLVDKLRWSGNALIWADRPEEAIPYLLRAISHDGQPGVPAALIYAAMTDLCLASLRCRSFACFQHLLADTRAHLAKRGLESWDHRLDRLASMAALRRGLPAEAFQLATRAWQKHLATPGGPHYQVGAYLQAIFLAAHALGDAAAMDQVLEDFSRDPETDIVLSRVRHAVCEAIRRAFEGVTVETGEVIKQLLVDALQLMRSGDYPREEAYDIFRLLSMLGQTREAKPFLALGPRWDKAGHALLRLDLAICRLAQTAGWQVPFYTRNFCQAYPPLRLLRNPARSHVAVLRLLKDAETYARETDLRMECGLNQQAVTLRRRWLVGSGRKEHGDFAEEVPDAHRRDFIVR